MTTEDISKQPKERARLTTEEVESSVCGAPGCGRTGVGKWCERHKKQVKAHGRLTPEREYSKLEVFRPCDEPGCLRPYSARGKCKKHYRAAREHALRAAG